MGLLFRKTSLTSALIATCIALLIMVAAMWFAIDFIGALNHWWIGNPVSVAVANGMEWLINAAFAVIVSVVKFLYAQSMALLMRLGASRDVAFGINMVVALLLNLTVVFFAFRWELRLSRKMRKPAVRRT